MNDLFEHRPMAMLLKYSAISSLPAGLDGSDSKLGSPRHAPRSHKH